MSNPYAAPAADLSRVIDDGQTYTPKLLDVKGRIGRFRYLAYSTAAGLVLTIGAALISKVMVSISTSLLFISMLAYIPAFIVAIIMAKRRLNDMNKSAWLCLLAIIPLANLYFFFILFFGRGSPGSNRFGPAPTENTQAVKIGAWAVIGINVVVLGFMFTNFAAYTKFMESVNPGAAALTAAAMPETPTETPTDASAEGDSATPTETPAETPGAPAAPKE